jgi:CDP-6-deoxy-D-xylo-4-hexulose-3-dehydrase
MSNKKILLSEDTITKEHLVKVSDWLLTNPRLTKGELTEQFEEKFSNHIGVKHSVFVNSGSSAILLLLASLVQSGHLSKNSVVAVPRVSWSTDVSSIMYAGLEFVFVDCNLEDLSIDISKFEKIIKANPRVDALLLVQVLGLVPNMDEIVSICKDNDILLIEDTCESLGSTYMGRMLGSFGKASVFSTYFGHHFSTIEGGMVCTDDSHLYNILKSMRSHGWDRDLDEVHQTKLRTQYKIDEFKSKYTFYYPSFNFRASDLQAFIGLLQMDSLYGIYNRRNENYNEYLNMFNGKMWVPESNGFTSSFAYPILANNIEQKNRIVKALDTAGIENRPLICGDMMNQPYVRDFFGEEEYVNNSSSAGIVDKLGLYVPNHPSISIDDVKYISSTILREVGYE